MPGRGRPPKPVEEKRRTGNPGRRPLPSKALVIALPMADGIPPLPEGFNFGLEARRCWASVWSAGALWISPATDGKTVVELCLLADDLAIARERYHATREPNDAKVLLLASKAYTSCLAAIGFDPTSRSKLGVAEVRAQSKLEELRDKRTKREAGRR